MLRQAADAAELDDVKNLAVIDRLLGSAKVMDAVRTVMGAVDAQHVQVAEQAISDVMLVIDFVAGVGVEKDLWQVHGFRHVDSHDGGRQLVECLAHLGSHDDAMNPGLLVGVGDRCAVSRRPVPQIPVRVTRIATDSECDRLPNQYRAIERNNRRSMRGERLAGGLILRCSKARQQAGDKAESHQDGGRLASELILV